MPTYSVSSVGVFLSIQQKKKVAEAITESHHDNTGAPGFFAQVFFKNCAGEDHFLGGNQNTHPHIFINGLIRVGRSAEAKNSLMTRVVAAVAEICSIGREDIWMYIQDISAAQMIEYGRVLPEPGLEAEWIEKVSPEKRVALADDGVNL
ncbi:tautomerase family protein [Pseudohalocynthiibacter sp. F2068]|uniref:tautomerase family protein n=1 Tax=Pseudohalocynthiibacter sp. F2068 TaxID=2926418 RepID=UPI001FF4F534|nr:tautomerase family protein [Pseudohalocynthiibacter sp. F2068]MCK0103250.1 tautomerase family protein [Pseudohalocynthiibacter sp. F2068]